MKTLYVAGVLMLACAGDLFVFCAKPWSPGASAGTSLPERWSIDRFRALQTHERESRWDTVPPLVAQAMEFALYLDPPEPPAPPEGPRAQVSSATARQPAATAPQFRLLLTSCHHTHPEESVALISEPGGGDHWTRPGDRVGHLVVESIKDGALVCRDGNRLHEVTVTTKDTVGSAFPASVPSAPTPNVESDMRIVNALRMRRSAGRVPSVRPAEYERK